MAADLVTKTGHKNDRGDYNRVEEKGESICVTKTV